MELDIIVNKHASFQLFPKSVIKLILKLIYDISSVYYFLKTSEAHTGGTTERCIE